MLKGLRPLQASIAIATLCRFLVAHGSIFDEGVTLYDLRSLKSGSSTRCNHSTETMLRKSKIFKSLRPLQASIAKANLCRFLVATVSHSRKTCTIFRVRRSLTSHVCAPQTYSKPSMRRPLPSCMVDPIVPTLMCEKVTCDFGNVLRKYLGSLAGPQARWWDRPNPTRAC